MTTSFAAMPDRVVITTNGVPRESSIDEFFSLPLNQQVEFLLKGEVSFFCGASLLRTTDALKVMRQQRVAGLPPARPATR